MRPFRKKRECLQRFIKDLTAKKLQMKISTGKLEAKDFLGEERIPLIEYT